MKPHYRPQQGTGAGFPGQTSAENRILPVVLSEASLPSDGDGTVQIKPAHMWGAFRRRWLLATTLGILAALPVVYLAWTYTPTPFRAEAEILIRLQRPRDIYETQDDKINSNFDVFKQSQMKLVLHPDTIRQALSSDGIAQLSILKAIPATEDPIDWIRENVVVASTSKEFFTISIEGENPGEIAKLVNAIKDAYFDRSYAVSSRSLGARQRKIKDDVEDFNTQIEAIEKNIDELTKLTKAPSPTQDDSRYGGVADYIIALQGEIRALSLKLIELRSKQKRLTAGSKDAPGDVPQPDISDENLNEFIESDPAYKLKQRIIEKIDSELEAVRNQFTGQPPIIQKLLDDRKRVENDLAELKAELEKLIREGRPGGLLDEDAIDGAALDAEIKDVEQLRKGYEDELEKLKQEEIDIGLALISLAHLEEDREQLKGFRSQLEDELFKMQIEKDSGEQIELSYEAKVPTRRETKKRTMFTAGGGLGSFGFIVVCVVLLEMRFMRIGSLKQLEQEFNIPILGTIPNLPARFMGMQDSTGKAAYYKHAFTESIDTTRTMLLNQQKTRPDQKIIMVASALGGEGKSTLSCHLAISFARGGRRTLLVDGDLRSPRVHEVFQLDDFPGLCEALRDETPVEKCIAPTAIPGLSLLPAGELDQRTLQLLAEDRVAEVLNHLRNQFDVIVFDSAPFLPVTDSLLLLQSVDGVVLSIRKDVTRISKVAAALSKIEMLGGNLLGAVVIGIDEADYGYRSKYIRNYHKGVSRQNEPEIVEATA